MTIATFLAIGYHLISRLAYVVGVGVALTKQNRDQVFTRVHGAEAGFRRFRRGASWVMNNDAVSFIALCIITRNTVSWDVPSPLLVATGLLGIVLGISVKWWAAVRIGYAAYYWHNFFVPVSPAALDPPGPYRYLRNPMYTIGYLHMYGFALLTGSGIGLLAAAFDQAAILVFHHWVEKPHFLRLSRGEPEGQPVRAQT